MSEINCIELLKFLEKHGGQKHSKDNTPEKEEGQKAEAIEKEIQNHLSQKFKYDASKSVQQWQNSGNMTTYFWIQLKSYSYKFLPISISIFAEKYLGETPRFRVTIEYDYKFGEDKKIDCLDKYKKLINKELPQDDFHFFVCIDGRNTYNYLLAEASNDLLKSLYNNSENEISYFDSSLEQIKKCSIRKISRIQISKIIKETDNNRIILSEIEEAFSLLLPIYESICSEVDMSMQEKINSYTLTTPLPFELTTFMTDTIYTTRYITSLLAKPFTILTGNSGTGKTRIATQLAAWLKKETDTGVTNSLVVPVGADWTDNTKILGYFNPLANNGTGDYVKSDVLSFIELANDNPKIPFFLILDEMNLSHVERYFSDFLSAMESKKPILLYKKSDGCECTVKESITLPENLFVTGTVNIDETTYMFSPKVLDRANVIEFSPDKDDVLKIFSNDSKSKDVEPAQEGMAEGFVELAEKVRGFANRPDEKDGKELEKIMGELYDILKPAGFEFAYRTTKEIVLYYCAAKSLDSNISLMKIVDQQIVQKILPKIHGNKKQIGELLSKLKEKLAEHDEFELSQTKVQSMIEKLDKFQYASFI